MKRLVIVLAVAVLLGGALWFLQRLVVPKYITENEEGVLCSEYYDNAGGNDESHYPDIRCAQARQASHRPVMKINNV